jgi:hypothetical protein
VGRQAAGVALGRHRGGWRLVAVHSPCLTNSSRVRPNGLNCCHITPTNRKRFVLHACAVSTWFSRGRPTAPTADGYVVPLDVLTWPVCYHGPPNQGRKVFRLTASDGRVEEASLPKRPGAIALRDGKPGLLVAYEASVCVGVCVGGVFVHLDALCRIASHGLLICARTYR